jgi:hypothetical protein
MLPPCRTAQRCLHPEKECEREGGERTQENAGGREGSGHRDRMRLPGEGRRDGEASWLRSRWQRSAGAEWRCKGRTPQETAAAPERTQEPLAAVLRSGAPSPERPQIS